VSIYQQLYLAMVDYTREFGYIETFTYTQLAAALQLASIRESNI
jgi:hypothetical protein